MARLCQLRHQNRKSVKRFDKASELWARVKSLLSYPSTSCAFKKASKRMRKTFRHYCHLKQPRKTIESDE